MSHPILVAGIDPGLDGYVCLLGPGLVEPAFFAAPVRELPGGGRVYDRPALNALAAGLKAGDVQAVALEVQAPRPRESGRSAFTLGVGYGGWLQALSAAGLKVVEVEPQTWKRTLGLPGDKARKGRKAKAVALAARLYPAVDLRPRERAPGARVSSSDKAEALLIAHWLLGRETAKAGGPLS